MISIDMQSGDVTQTNSYLSTVVVLAILDEAGTSEHQQARAVCMIDGLLWLPQEEFSF